MFCLHHIRRNVMFNLHIGLQASKLGQPIVHVTADTVCIYHIFPLLSLLFAANTDLIHFDTANEKRL